VDLHLHSRYSYDCATQLGELVDRARQLGLDRLAVTDHDTAEGALRLSEMAPELVIVGEEVRTTEGEIIGLFLTGTVPAGGTPEEVCDAIHAMGGLTYACHPFDVRRAHFSLERLAALAPRLDIIEVHNSWASPEANRMARAVCRRLGKAAAAGSDAHAAHELGRCWMEIPAFEGPQGLLAAVARGRRVIRVPAGRGRRA
jgi:predicted metal-dependent phosphoesterase TrpH